MSQAELVFLGSGDAFGSGGRFQTCLLLRGSGGSVLLDCGASSLIAMKRACINPGEIGIVLLTHLHGDHFGGLPFLILDRQFSGREEQLLIAGPAGVQSRVEAAMEVLFRGSSKVTRRFATRFIELFDGRRTELHGLAVTPFAVEHFSGSPSHALRVEYDGKVIVYSGDTQWTENLARAANGADLFVCEAYFFEKKIKYHLDYRTLREHLARLECKRIVLTHMSEDMLKHTNDVDVEVAHDGMVIAL